MKYIKEYKEIDWEDWDEDESEGIEKYLYKNNVVIKIDNGYGDEFVKWLDDNNIKWNAGGTVKNIQSILFWQSYVKILSPDDKEWFNIGINSTFKIKLLPKNKLNPSLKIVNFKNIIK
jgi:hypothetical protein